MFAASQEVELLPFFLDLLKNHFPGMVGASASLARSFSVTPLTPLAQSSF